MDAGKTVRGCDVTAVARWGCGEHPGRSRKEDNSGREDSTRCWVLGGDRSQPPSWSPHQAYEQQATPTPAPAPARPQEPARPL